GEELRRAGYQQLIKKPASAGFFMGHIAGWRCAYPAYKTRRPCKRSAAGQKGYANIVIRYAINSAICAAPFSTLVRPVEKDIWHSSKDATITIISGAPSANCNSFPVIKAINVTTGTVREMVARTEPKNRFIARCT